MVSRPGEAVSGSNTGRPIMVLLDALGKRWALRLLWELNRQQPASFRELQARCENISPTSLTTRLKDLRDSHLVELTGSGYQLTEGGRTLSALLAPLDAWAQDWARRFEAADPTLPQD